MKRGVTRGYRFSRAINCIADMIARRINVTAIAVIVAALLLSSAPAGVIISIGVTALNVASTPQRCGTIRSQEIRSMPGCTPNAMHKNRFGFNRPGFGARIATQLHMSSTDTDQQSSKKKKATEVAQAEFWKAQSALAESMTEKVDKNVKEENREKFAKRRLALVNETLLFSTLIFAFLWLIGSNPFTAISYAFGATLGTAYSYGLGKYVETIGGSADDVEDLQGAGVGQARFAFLILLFVFVGKFRAFGLQEIPSIMGFFTYQIASLSQGLREYDD